jgi:anti-sigma-K factor RskA
MINESQQEQASLYVLGALDDRERQAFEAQLPDSEELRELVRDLQHATVALAGRCRSINPPARLREKVLEQIASRRSRPPPNLIGLALCWPVCGS